jgi:hypothetical protein
LTIAVIPFLEVKSIAAVQHGRNMALGVLGVKAGLKNIAVHHSEPRGRAECGYHFEI